MGSTVNRQMAKKSTVNRQKRNIFTVNRQMSEPKLAFIKFIFLLFNFLIFSQNNFFKHFLKCFLILLIFFKQFLNYRILKFRYSNMSKIIPFH